MKSKITIGVTCFNAAETIERAVVSATRQTWPDFEVVVVDDASNDNSWEILQTIAQREPRVRVIRHDVNRGYPGALNSILEAAHGEFVAIFDDDDDNVSDRLQAQWERITEYERRTGAKQVFCYSNRNVVKVRQSSPDHVAKAIGRVGPEPHGPTVADYILGIGADSRFVWGMFGSCTLMARREAFLSVGSFDESFRRCAEWDMAIRGALMGAHFIAVDRPLITQYKTATTDKAGTIPLKYALQLRAKHRAYLNKQWAYAASWAVMHARFYGSVGRRWKSRAYLAMALLLRPSLLKSYLSLRRQFRADLRVPGQ